MKKWDIVHPIHALFLLRFVLQLGDKIDISLREHLMLNLAIVRAFHSFYFILWLLDITNYFTSLFHVIVQFLTIYWLQNLFKYICIVLGLKIQLPFKDKELNKIAAFFNVITFLLTCAALVQPSWFRIKGLHCTQSLSPAQFFTFDDDDDDDQLTIHQNKDYDPINRSDFNGKSIFFFIRGKRPAGTPRCSYTPMKLQYQWNCRCIAGLWGHT